MYGPGAIVITRAAPWSSVGCRPVLSRHRNAGLFDKPVAGVALAHGINANLLRRWIVRQRRESAKTIEPSRTVLLPVSVQRASPAPEAFGNGGMSTATTKPRRVGAATIEIEVYGTRVHLRGGVDAETLRAVLDVLSQR